jgi:hypothetical protein
MILECSVHLALNSIDMDMLPFTGSIADHEVAPIARLDVDAPFLERRIAFHLAYPLPKVLPKFIVVLKAERYRSHSEPLDFSILLLNLLRLCGSYLSVDNWPSVVVFTALE